MVRYLLKRVSSRAVDYVVVPKGQLYNKKLFKGYNIVNAKSYREAIKKKYGIKLGKNVKRKSMRGY